MHINCLPLFKRNLILIKAITKFDPKEGLPLTSQEFSGYSFACEHCLQPVTYFVGNYVSFKALHWLIVDSSNYITTSKAHTCRHLVIVPASFKSKFIFHGSYQLTVFVRSGANLPHKETTFAINCDIKFEKFYFKLDIDCLQLLDTLHCEIISTVIQLSKVRPVKYLRFLIIRL